MADAATLQRRRLRGPPCPPRRRTSRRPEAPHCRPPVEVPGGDRATQLPEAVPSYLPTGEEAARRAAGAAAAPEDMGEILAAPVAPTAAAARPS